jgi:urease accessory protein UreH
MYWSDALMSGRSARGEDWMFSEVAHELRLRVDGSLKYVERYRLRPEQRAVVAGPIAGKARYLGTTLVHHAAATGKTAEAWQHETDRRSTCGAAWISSRRTSSSRGCSAGTARGFAVRGWRFESTPRTGCSRRLSCNSAGDVRCVIS